MRNVLFATTALVATAVAGSAFAKGHATWSISGDSTVGYNDEIEGGLFNENNVNLNATADFGNGYSGAAHVRINLDWDEAGESGDDEVEFKSIYLMTPVGKLEFADSFDGTTAGDSFYKDRDGMALDVFNGDGHAGLKWSGDFGQFGYAISADDFDDATCDDNFSVGAGGSFGPATVGVGFDNNSGCSGDTAMGVSADFAVGPADVGVSYIDVDGDTSIGVAGSVEVMPGTRVGAYYAVNDPADDRYGVTLDFASGPFTLAFDYDTGDGAVVDNFEVDVSFDAGNGIMLYAGYDDQDVTTSGGTGAFYAGATIEVTSNVDVTVSYAEADEIGGPEFKEGTSLFATITW